MTPLSLHTNLKLLIKANFNTVTQHHSMLQIVSNRERSHKSYQCLDGCKAHLRFGRSSCHRRQHQGSALMVLGEASIGAQVTHHTRCQVSHICAQKALVHCMKKETITSQKPCKKERAIWFLNQTRWLLQHMLVSAAGTMIVITKTYANNMWFTIVQLCATRVVTAFLDCFEGPPPNASSSDPVQHGPRSQ